MEDITAKDLLNLDMAMVATLDPMEDMDMEVDIMEATVHMVVDMDAAMEVVIMERERLGMEVMEVAMAEVMEEVMGEAIL